MRNHMNVRKAWLVGAAICLASFTKISTAEAGASAFIGANFPVGDFNSGAEVGWTLGGYYTVPVLAVLDVGGLVAYNDFSTSNDNTSGQLPGDGFDAWEIQALGQANILFLKGYLGLGLANYSGVGDDGSSKRKTKWAWQAGVAATFLFLEGRLGYHRIDLGDGSSEWISLSAGIVF
jgi:hypothetical protein